MSKLRPVKQKIEARNQKTETNQEKPAGLETAGLPNLREQLETLLATQPVLRVKLLEALRTGRYLISITRQHKEKPEDKNDLHHWWIRNQFEVIDVLPSFRHIIADFTSKEMPNAEINAEGWV